MLIEVDKSCQVAISEATDAECTSEPTARGGNTIVIAGVVGGVLVVLLIAITVVVIVISALVFKRRRAKLTLQREHK